MAVEPVPEALALDAAPDFTGVFGGGVVELLYGGDAGAVKAAFHVFADAGEVGEFLGEEFFFEIGFCQKGQAVGFLHFTGNFSEQGIGGNADGAVDGGADILPKAALNVFGDFGGGFFASFAGGEAG